MKKALLLLTGMAMLSLSVVGAHAAKEGDDESRQVTQCELAKLLVNVLGLARFVPANPSCQQSFAVLMDNNIMPKDGWDGDKIVTRADLARVIVLALKRQHEVEDPDNPQSWIDFLKSIGIPIDTVGEAIETLEPLPEPVAPNVAQAVTDPITKRHVFDPTDETQYGVDMAALVRVLSQMEFMNGEFRPKPITQD